jgi:hypothetical protein
MRIARSVTTGRYISVEISDSRNTFNVSPDPDAVRIGELFAKARGVPHHTTPPVPPVPPLVNGYHETDTTPNRCHWCREPFARGHMRYPVKTGVNHSGGWGLASVCMACFKNTKIDEASPFKRYERKCRGCSEPLLTPVAERGWDEVCSNRCSQRAWRKDRRGKGSTVPWKAHSPRCEACRGPILDRTRADAKFCSAKCRQWHYRQRRAQASSVGRGSVT